MFQPPKNASDFPVLYTQWVASVLYSRLSSRRSSLGCGYQAVFGSMYVSGKLPSYPSRKLTLTFTSGFGRNFRFGEGQVGSVPEKYIDSCVLGQDFLLSQYLVPLNCFKCWGVGVTLRSISIPSRGSIERFISLYAVEIEIGVGLMGHLSQGQGLSLSFEHSKAILPNGNIRVEKGGV